MTDDTRGNGAPGNAELMRLLTLLRDDVRQLRTEIKDDLAQFVRIDVQTAHNTTVDVQLKGLEDEVHVAHKRIDKAEDAVVANRRLVVGSFLFPLVVGLVVALVTYTVLVHK